MERTVSRKDICFMASVGDLTYFDRQSCAIIEISRRKSLILGAALWHFWSARETSVTDLYEYFVASFKKSKKDVDVDKTRGVGICKEVLISVI